MLPSPSARTAAPRKLGRPRLLIVGCGDVGGRLLALMQRTHRVFALTSQAERLPDLRAAGAVPLLGNLDAPASLRRLRGLASQTVHLAPPAPQGLEDPRTAHLLNVLSRPAFASGQRSQASAKTARILPESRRRYAKTSSAQRLVYGSTSGVYGDCGGAWVNEARPCRPSNARAKRRVAAEQHCRRWGKRGHSATTIRIPGIYAADRLPLTRLQNRTPALTQEDDVYTNHIHADDLARILRAAVFRGRPQRVVHASDDSTLKMAEYFDVVAAWAGLPLAPRLPMTALSQALSPVQLSFMQESRRLENQRLRQELRCTLLYPTVQDFLLQTPAPRLAAA